MLTGELTGKLRAADRNIVVTILVITVLYSEDLYISELRRNRN